jgi:excisionase family DNA binding protein
VVSFSRGGSRSTNVMDSNVSAALPTDLIHPAQGAKILGISGPTLWGWIRSGKLRAWRLEGARMGVSKADVEAICQLAVMPPQLLGRDGNMERLPKDREEQAEREANKEEERKLRKGRAK